MIIQVLKIIIGLILIILGVFVIINLLISCFKEIKELLRK